MQVLAFSILILKDFMSLKSRRNCLTEMSPADKQSNIAVNLRKGKNMGEEELGQTMRKCTRQAALTANAGHSAFPMVSFRLCFRPIIRSQSFHNFHFSPLSYPLKSILITNFLRGDRRGQAIN